MKKKYNTNMFFFSCLIFLTKAISSYAQENITCNNFGHFDLYIDVVPPGTDGASLLIDNRDDFPVEAGTGRTIVPADFRDFAGGLHKTDDPGWVIKGGDFLGGEVLWFRALGSLRFWDKNEQRWLNDSPNGERVRYFGAIPPEIMGINEDLDFYEEGTIWTGAGIEGPLEAPIEQAVDVSPQYDAIHSHLDFCLEGKKDSGEMGDCTRPEVVWSDSDPDPPTGKPTVGAYLIEIQLFSQAVHSNGQQQKYIDSKPVKVLLNNGLVENECVDAISALTTYRPQFDSSEALPAAGVLIMTGP